MPTEKEILDALKTLQKVCECTRGKCGNCVLQNSDKSCGVVFDNTGYSRNSLQEWKLKDEELPRLILG